MTTRKIVITLALLLTVFVLLPVQQAAAVPPLCKDGVVGLGWIDSPSGKGAAGFAFAAGYFFGPNRPPSVNLYYADPGSKILVAALSIDRYEGYGPTDRLFAGRAWVKSGRTAGETNYTLEVLDYARPGGGVDRFFIMSLKPDGSGTYYQVYNAILEGGDVSIRNHDTTTEGC